MCNLVLLVDEDPKYRGFLRTVLEERGYRVLEAQDGVEGLRLARAHHPDLIIREHPVPLPDGSTLAETLKADPATSSILIVTITARATVPDIRAALEDNSVRVLLKPVHPLRVAQTVEGLIGGPA